MEPITEEIHLEKEWFEQARKQTVETLAGFVNHIMNDYGHDYGTVCHAVAACAIAAMSAADNTPNGGITGFQASFVMWDFVRQVSYTNNRCGLRMVNYDDFLYPQYEYKYEKSITPKTWEAIQKQAREKLYENDSAHPDVVEHWSNIVNGIVPFGYIVKEDNQ